MRTHKSLTTILLLTLAATLTTTQAQEQKLSETYTADCIVRITADPAILPLNEQTVKYLLFGSEVGLKSIREIIGTGMDRNIVDFLTIKWLSGTLQMAPSVTTDTRQESGRQQADPLNQTPMSGSSSTGMMSGMGSMGTGGMGMSTGIGDPGMMGGMGGGMEGAGSGAMGMGSMSGMMGTGGMPGMGMGMGGTGMMGGMMSDTMMGGSMGFGMGGGQMTSSALQQNVTFGLSVSLPKNKIPAAKELLEQLIKNLQGSLNSAYERYESQLSDNITLAERKQEYAQVQLDALTGGRSFGNDQIRQSLNQYMDLSMLSQEMPFAEAIKILKNSVSPPLPIVVMWNQLMDKGDISPDSPIGMDGIPEIKVESALKTLLRAVTGGNCELGYGIEEDVIIISLKDSSNKSQTLLGATPVEIDVRDLIERRRQLASNIRQYELRIATSEARQQAIHMQIDEMRREAVQKLKEDSVTQEMKQLVALSESNLHNMEDQVRAGRLPQTALTDTQEKIAKAKIDLARRREELGLSAGGRQLAGFSEDLSKLTIDMVEHKAALEILRRQLAEADQQLAQARVSDPRASQIQTAQRILQFAEQQVIALNRQLTTLQRPMVTTIGAH